MERVTNMTNHSSTSQAAPNDILQEEYNRAPYQSFPFPQSHPTHLYTLAKLFGLTPTPIEKSRVLEIGCAGGGNIIPMAYHFPTAEFLGFDLAEKQIEEGLQQISDLNIKNIILRQQSIVDFSPKEGKFDYIICHGVYSWVDSPVRDKILQICNENLSKNGIAYISYNTFPGWNMVNSVKDLMQWHTKTITDPTIKAQQARSILNFIANGLQQDTSAYATFLRNEINLLSRYADSYLLHEHLSSFNNPVYFYQFMEKATINKLSYLSDAVIETMFSDNLPPVFATELKKINNIIIMGQYMDFIQNQRFRCTLLCHDDQKINRALKTNDVEQFHLQLKAKPEKEDLNEKDLGEGKDITFKNNAVTLKVRNALSQMAMLILHEERFKSISYNELFQKLMKRSKVNDADKLKHILNEELNLMRTILGGIIEINAYPPTHELTVSAKPIACPFVRYQGAKKSFVTNRRHQAVRLSPVGLELLPLLDGTNDLESMQQHVIKQIENGKLSVLDKDKNLVTDKNKIKEQTEGAVENELKFMAINALLISSEKKKSH